MKLRSILRILSFLAFASACLAGYSYYGSLKDYAFQEAERNALTHLQTTKKNLSAFFSGNTKPVRVLAGMKALGEHLASPNQKTLAEANRILDLFKTTLSVNVCYLMDANGLTRASSNRMDKDSFVGRNFSFRPYFQDAMQSLPSSYLALGTTSRKRGAYYSYPVYHENQDTPIGIAVIKASIPFVEKELATKDNSIQLVVDPHGLVFISSRPEWLYHLLWPLPPSEIEKLRQSRQFGDGPWPQTGMVRKGNKFAVDENGKKYLFHQSDVDNYPQWKIIQLYDLKMASKLVSEPLWNIMGPVIFILCSLLGVSIFFLYRQASQEIARRRSVESALRKSEKRYRFLYHNTPAMLHSIDKEGNLISVSNFWSDALGYTKNEVIGKNFTDFFSPESKKYALEKVFPTFLEKGFVKDVPYRMIKKDGEAIEVLLSAITDTDEHKNTFRSLAVSMDVTERNKAERALQQARDELRKYSKTLESEVRKRTREISGILQYTPAVIYIKDADGRYTMVNSKFETVFGIGSHAVKGKTDNDILAPDIAKQFLENDSRVLKNRQSIQVEEVIRIDGTTYTYLSTKFPLYDGRKRVTGVCGIATDISALKSAQEQLRRLSGAIMAKQEKERAYLARELHDELGQVLTALRMEAVWIRNRVHHSDPAVAARALTMCDLIDKTIEEVRSLAIRLRPGVLDHLGLVEAIEWYTADYERRFDVACVFEHEKYPEIRGNVATAAYRITQEALTNVARHASATRAQVVLKIKNGCLVLSIKDDGKGFNADALGEGEGLGLTNMSERAKLVGGSMDIQSQPGKGTSISFKVPI